MPNLWLRTNYEQPTLPVLGEADRQGYFEAVCKLHANCTMSRTAAPPKRGRVFSHPGQGRPMGLLLAWLEAADKHDWGAPGVGEHKDYRPGEAERSAARGKLQGSELGRSMLERERSPARGERSEPNSPI